MSNRSQGYPLELRERAIRLVTEVHGHHDSEWAAIESVATKLGDRVDRDAVQVDPQERGRHRPAPRCAQ